MSPDSLRNPFHPPDQRTGTSSELTRHLLPSADAQALTEALGEEESSRSEPQQDLPPASDISMSGEEQKEVEKEPYWTKDQYIEWAEEVTEDKSWIDKIFKFQPDGTTIVEGNLYLLDTKIKQLPIGLMEVKGDLNVSENPFLKLNGYPKKVGGSFWCNESNLTSLQGMPKEVGGYISLVYNKISSLDGIPDKVIGNLYLSNNQLENLNGISREISGSLFLGYNKKLTSLEALRGVKIGGDLWLKSIPATTIPEGIEIVGVTHIYRKQTDLIADAEGKGYRVEIV